MRASYKKIISTSLFKLFPCNFAKKNLKNIPIESYLGVQEAPKAHKTSKFPEIEIKIVKFNKKEQDELKAQRIQEKPIPCSPIIDSLTVFFEILNREKLMNSVFKS